MRKRSGINWGEESRKNQEGVEEKEWGWNSGKGKKGKGKYEREGMEGKKENNCIYWLNFKIIFIECEILKRCLPIMLLCSLRLRIPRTLIPLISRNKMARCRLSACRNLKYYRSQLWANYLSQRAPVTAGTGMSLSSAVGIVTGYSLQFESQ
jgi:hypothetical protein